MKYSLEQLMVFEQVARSGSFSAAARNMKRSQSAVNMAMSNLEDEFNVRLFERSPRQVTLTGEGTVLREYIKTVLEQCNVLEQRVADYNIQTEACITLAIEVPYPTIAPVLYEFAMTFPQVDIHIREPHHGDVAGLVSRGEVDAGIVLSRRIDSDRLQFIQLGKLIMVHVVSASHPLVNQSPVSFTDLHRWRHITFGLQEQHIATTEYLGSPMLWRVESYNAMIAAAIAGLGWASLPRLFVQKELSEGTLVELRQQEYPHTDWVVGVDLLWSKKKNVGNSLNWLRNRIIQHKIFEHDNSGNRTTL
ncbi:LysR family transcriptional regulator [Erwinia sp. S43]|uniref:LysR family transcriptional regulator n=1 Tax=Erwiniaceae TaxID=1903409 RepID=UPI00190DFA8D|nr:MULTISPECIES: LysR family transcriptional regulator [Erwiniaceae]MBK0034529.1 LysR family transcriptional regulator [Erwinia sp. S43]MBM7344477.1 DNA-binding transcriptional LysR family regulator [Pantoea coffeiphila]MCW1877338.1 LysR family transcriptional regulator [Erwinia sp. INIA01]